MYFSPVKLLFQADWERSFWLQVQLPAELASALCYHNSSLYSHWLGACSSRRASCCYWKRTKCSHTSNYRVGERAAECALSDWRKGTRGILVISYLMQIIARALMCSGNSEQKGPGSFCSFWCCFGMRAVELGCWKGGALCPWLISFFLGLFLV